MKRDKNTVTLYVDKDMVNIHKASLDMYEALKIACAEIQVKGYVSDNTKRVLKQAKAKGDK